MISVIPITQPFSCNLDMFRIISIFLVQSVYLTVRKPKNFTEFLFREHRIFCKHIQFRTARIFCDWKYSRHVGKNHIWAVFQQAPQIGKIFPFFFFRYKRLMKQKIPLIKNKYKSVLTIFSVNFHQCINCRFFPVQLSLRICSFQISHQTLLYPCNIFFISSTLS